VGLVRQGSASPAETHLRLAIQRHSLPTPDLNAKVYSRSFEYLGRGDFVFGEARVVVEYEGDHHRVDAATFRQDIRRRERFEDEGWRMVRATGDDLGRTRQQFLARLERLLDERSPGMGSSCANHDRTRR
jgi:very-short-patch-repair endonuclease